MTESVYKILRKRKKEKIYSSDIITDFESINQQSRLMIQNSKEELTVSNIKDIEKSRKHENIS